MKETSLTVRRIPDSVKQALRVRAAESGRSLEEEVRQILKKAASEAPSARVSLAERIASIMDPIGGVNLDLPQRSALREPPRFDDD